MKAIKIWYKGKVIDTIYTLDDTTDEYVDGIVAHEIEYNAEWEEC